MYRYEYCGPVMHFDKCIQRMWRGITYANSEDKARNNLTYQCKKELKKSPNTRISLPGQIVLAVVKR